MAATRLVSVVVPTYRDWPRLAQCLKALTEQSYPPERLEILVVNNAPEDTPPADLPMPANARMIDEPAKGSYAARNAAVRVAAGEILLFTDSDCAPDPGWCEGAVRFLEHNPQVARVGGDILLGAPQRRLGIADVYERAFAFPVARYVSRGWAPTANMGTWSHVFACVGPFDEDYFSGEDGAWGQRAAALGYAIGYCPDAVVVHPPRTLGGVVRKRRRITGARLLREIEAHGRAHMAMRFGPRALRRLLPPTAQVKALVRLREVPGRLKLGAYFFIWYLRIDTEIIRARILFFGAEAERR